MDNQDDDWLEKTLKADGVVDIPTAILIYHIVGYSAAVNNDYEQQAIKNGLNVLGVKE